MTLPPSSAGGVGRRGVVRLAALAAAAATTGCALSLLPDPPQLYTLTPKSTFQPDLPMVDWLLLIEQPVAATGLDTVRVPISRSPMTLDYYASVAWTDRAPSMVQRLLVESFENSGRIVSVGRDSVGLRGDFMLKSELREFQVEQWEPGPPRVNVSLNVKLVRLPERQIIAGQTFSSTIQAQSNEFSQIIMAFDEALGAVLKSAVAWTLITGEQDRKTRGTS